MSRWEPDAAGRLRQTAMELFGERGYDETTVADIAERAGLTARTFFRYFKDKREVLFAGSSELRATMVDALLAAPHDATPMTAVAAALTASATRLGSHRALSRQRTELIATHADLQERELMKLSDLSAALAVALGERGVEDLAASLAADAGMACFRIAFGRWVAETQDRPLSAVMDETLAELRLVAAG